VFNSATQVFPALTSKEYYRTIGFKQIAYIYGDTEQSFRKTADLINRIRHQEAGGTPYRTLQETTQKEGERIIDSMREKTRLSLIENGFDEDGQPIAVDKKYSQAEGKIIEGDKVRAAAGKFSGQYDIDKLMGNPVFFESPESTVNISIDDVTVKRQEEKRHEKREVKEGKRKYAHNTICHVEQGNLCYTLNGGGIKEVLMFLISFIFTNGLTKMRLQFFTDGHTKLNETIFKCFSWCANIGMILDWYHLHKKCKERLSMALRGKRIRNDILETLMPLLWHGLTVDAIAHLRGIANDDIKNIDEMEKMIEYLERNRNYIPCYALRRELGLRNGSSIGEKMNDLIVSERQKHKGMAWSKIGSVALATMTALKRNNEFGKWFEKNELNFCLAG